MAAAPREIDVRDIFECAEHSLALHAAAVQDIRAAFYATQAQLEADFAAKERGLEAEHAAILHEVDDRLACGEARLEAERATIDAEKIRISNRRCLIGTAVRLRPSQALLAKDRQRLEDDRAAFIRETDEKLAREEELQQRIRASALPPDDVVKLNVGGARFETSRGVLTKVEESMLALMFGRCDAMLQPDPSDGSIFIDRDGERFGIFLDFLRGDPTDGQRMQSAIRAFPKAAQEALVQELNYFGLETAVFGVRPWTDDATFQPGPLMSEPRSTCGAVVAGGRVILIGGWNNYWPRLGHF